MKFRLAAVLCMLSFSGTAFSADAVKVRIHDYFYPARKHAVWNYLTPRENGTYAPTVVRIEDLSHRMQLFDTKDGKLVEKWKNVLWMSTISGKLSGGKILPSTGVIGSDFYGKGPNYAIYGFNNASNHTSICLYPGAVFPEILQARKPVSVKTRAFDALGGRGPDITATAELLGKTSVTVPAGAFSDCIRLRFSLSYKGHSAVQEEWWAKGIGLVVSKTTDAKGISRFTRLHSYDLGEQVTFSFADSNGNFGVTSIFGWQTSRILHVKNNSARRENLIISLTGSDTFTFKRLGSKTIAPGGTTAIEVTFSPMDVKTYRATPKVEEQENPLNACTISLSGMGGF